MKTFGLIIGLLLTALITSAQTYNYSTYCSGMKVDTCKNVLHHSTCLAIRGVIEMSQFQIRIDSNYYYIFSKDTINAKVFYYVEDRNNNKDIAGCIIYDSFNGIFTMLSGDFLHQDILYMSFYLLPDNKKVKYINNPNENE